jgi:hypothetical protein
MAWRIVKQPNGLYARFADPVDHFTHYNMNREEAIRTCIEEYDCSTAEAESKLGRADEDVNWDGTKGRWKESLETIRMIHGQTELDSFLAEFEAAIIPQPPAPAAASSSSSS